MRSVRFTVQLALTSVLGVSLFSCATPPSAHVATLAEQIQSDTAIGRRMSEPFEAGLKIRSDMELSVFLRGVAAKMADTLPELKSSPIGVWIVADRDAKWRNYALPGNRVYLSSKLLKGMDYENEVAAAIAFELGHIVKRHAVLRLERQKNGAGIPGDLADEPSSVDYFSARGIFTYDQSELKAATEAAIRLMYQAEYDPRGLISLWNRYQSEPQHSPFEPEVLVKLVEWSRQSIALYSPLRNPIIRSEAFMKMQKRFRRL